MIEGQAESNHLAGNDFPFVDGRLTHDSPDTQNGGLRQVDDRREGVNVIHTQIRDRECASLHRLYAQAFLVGALDQTGSLHRDLP